MKTSKRTMEPFQIEIIKEELVLKLSYENLKLMNREQFKIFGINLFKWLDELRKSGLRKDDLVQCINEIYYIQSDPHAGASILLVPSKRIGKEYKLNSAENWGNIDYNFNPKNSIAAFYGCSSIKWAEKFLSITNVKHTAGNTGTAGGFRFWLRCIYAII